MCRTWEKGQLQSLDRHIPRQTPHLIALLTQKVRAKCQQRCCAVLLGHVNACVLPVESYLRLSTCCTSLTCRLV